MLTLVISLTMYKTNPCNFTPYNPPLGQSKTYAQATQGQHIHSDIPSPPLDIL